MAPEGAAAIASSPASWSCWAAATSWPSPVPSASSPAAPTTPPRCGRCRTPPPPRWCAALQRGGLPPFPVEEALMTLCVLAATAAWRRSWRQACRPQHSPSSPAFPASARRPLRWASCAARVRGRSRLRRPHRRRCRHPCARGAAAQQPAAALVSRWRRDPLRRARSAEPPGGGKPGRAEHLRCPRLRRNHRPAPLPRRRHRALLQRSLPARALA